MFPEWIKSTMTFLGIMILWDIIRIFIQAKITQLVLKKNFQNIRQDIDGLEEIIEEENK